MFFKKSWLNFLLPNFENSGSRLFRMRYGFNPPPDYSVIEMGNGKFSYSNSRTFQEGTNYYIASTRFNSKEEAQMAADFAKKEFLDEISSHIIKKIY